MGFQYKYVHKLGTGLKHSFETSNQRGNNLVIDHTTDLVWQQAGSETFMSHFELSEYLADLNEQAFGGYDDWRIPTIEKAMSLVEPNKKHGHLHIDPVFDKGYSIIWTADQMRANQVAWVVGFDQGACGYFGTGMPYYARAVRSK